MTSLLHRLMSWFHTARNEERLRLEIEDHLSQQTADNLRAGFPLEEARRQAILKFGPIESTKERYRDRQGLPFLETLAQDTRLAFRRLKKSPAFTLTTILTLALGIGATTSIFTLVYAVLVKSLAVANPSELYRLGKETRCCYWRGYSQDQEYSLVSYDLYKHFRDNTKGFSELAAFSASGQLFGVRRSGVSELAQAHTGQLVSGNYFATFGLNAYAGRLLTPNDDRPGATPVAVMSYRLWQEKYGSNPSVIGSIFYLNNKPFTVVGTTPPSFYGDTLRPNPPDLFLPFADPPNPKRDDDLKQPNLHWLDIIGRLQPTANPVSLEAEMRVELKQWLRSHWGEMTANDRAKFPEQTLFLSPGGAGITSMREDYEHWLQILMMVSGFVLLIVCANVANLLLVRGMEHRQQTSLSLALGAPASRLVRQALTESVLLSLLGGAAGLAVAYAGTSLILRFAFSTNNGPQSLPISPSPSLPVLLFTFSVSVITGIAFGIAPAWLATRFDPIEALRGANRSTAHAGSLARKSLVVIQAALSLVLLSASGLLTAALQNLETQDFGFDQTRRTIVKMDPRLAGYQPNQLTPLYNRIQEALANLPSVASAALCIYSPLGGNNYGSGVWVDGQPEPGARDNDNASWDRVTGGYFDVIGNRIVQGRGIDAQDTDNSQHVAVINEAFAKQFFKGKNPIGRYFGRSDLEESRLWKIVGIAKDARYLSFDLGRPITPFFFLPESQHDVFAKPKFIHFDEATHFLQDIVVVARPGATLSPQQLRQAMASVDPNLPLISIHTLKDQVAAQFSQQRLIARLTSFFGILSLVLASIGLYGITAYNASRRTQEIGIRMALGAGRSQVVTLVLKGAFALILTGLFIGLPLTFAAGRFLGNQLYGTNPYSPAVTSFAAVTLGLSALVASLIPAFRASRTSPLEALRNE